MKTLSLCALVALLSAPALYAAERTDLGVIMAIRDEGIRRSKVMETAAALTDRIGPRLTGSPAMNEANEWTRQQLEQWGMENARVEPWAPFGRGWSYEAASLRMVAPTTAQMYAIPKAWSPGTAGAIRGKAVLVNLRTKEDLEKQKGKLAGMIVLNGEARKLEPITKGFLERHDEESLENIALYQIQGERRFSPEYRQRREFQKTLNEFFAAEKVAAVIEPGSGGEGGTFDVASGGSFRASEPVGVPALVANIEHYNRVARLLDGGTPVELEVDVRATIEEEAKVANTVAEIPGTDKKGEVVMLGAHLDSWHGGTGATDNGGASAVMMEAMRILKAVGVKPRRTIRIALWSGEEQGLLGSRAYVAQHFGSRPEPTDPAERGLPVSMQKNPAPLTIKPEHAKLAAYFNLDNGAGKIRGIYAQENLAVVPIFRAWMEPLADLGVTTVATRNTSGTDHLSFDEVGLPGFQFIQDEVEYGRTHHSNMDVYDRLQREDMIQAAVVVATFVYNAAMRDEMLPRKALPK
ncbi:MAG TPA: M20/M25/M40 family metallo-hydrolase [Thermoanaerobaculia bacterium]|nr:M20/M25/M40 family metallo-hydrolase [Thermoanaerobaculia bacterium]